MCTACVGVGCSRKWRCMVQGGVAVFFLTGHGLLAVLAVCKCGTLCMCILFN